MFIASILAASVALAEPPSRASRYQDAGARYSRDGADGNRQHGQPRERGEYRGSGSGAYSQRPEAGTRYRERADAQPNREPSRGQPYAPQAGQWRNADHPFQSDRRGDDRRDGRDSRYPRPDYGDGHRDGREGYRNTSWDRDRHGWRDERGHRWHHDRYWYDSYRDDHFYYYGNRYYARQRFSIGFYYAPWGYTTRFWVRGDRLPLSYYGARYVIYDYYDYDLYAPPYASGWVRVGNDVLLIDMETGEVLDVVADLFW
jgi:Ni/Co efflux regulator RcnB